MKKQTPPQLLPNDLAFVAENRGEITNERTEDGRPVVKFYCIPEGLPDFTGDLQSVRCIFTQIRKKEVPPA